MYSRSYADSSGEVTASAEQEIVDAARQGAYTAVVDCFGRLHRSYYGRSVGKRVGDKPVDRLACVGGMQTIKQQVDRMVEFSKSRSPKHKDFFDIVDEMEDLLKSLP